MQIGKVLALLACGLLASETMAQRVGPGDTGGGDEVGLEFQASLKSALEIIRVSGRREFDELVRLDWNKALRGVRVLATDRKLYVTTNGVRQESVALNSPAKKLVEVNRGRWRNIPNPRIKEGIALHEVLSLQGLEQTGLYPYSGLYLSIFGLAPDPIFGGEPVRFVPMPSKVSKVYPYRCRARFVEGEGVTDGQISCVPGQHLGFLSAEYTYYLFRAPGRNNFPLKHFESFFQGGICGLDHVSRYSCDHPQDAEFGLSEEPQGAFVVGVTLSAAPAGNGPLTDIYGFAALPDSHGRCPANLIEARPWVAQPASVLPTGPNCPSDGCASSFINANNILNNMVIRTSDHGQPPDFEVWRHPNSTPCDRITGRCSWPDGGMLLNQRVPYIPLSPRVCVIPKAGLPQN